jgi:hypothetical protein
MTIQKQINDLYQSIKNLQQAKELIYKSAGVNYGEALKMGVKLDEQINGIMKTIIDMEHQLKGLKVVKTDKGNKWTFQVSSNGELVSRVYNSSKEYKYAIYAEMVDQDNKPCLPAFSMTRELLEKQVSKYRKARQYFINIQILEIN